MEEKQSKPGLLAWIAACAHPQGILIPDLKTWIQRRHRLWLSNCLSAAAAVAILSLAPALGAFLLGNADAREFGALSFDSRLAPSRAEALAALKALPGSQGIIGHALDCLDALADRSARPGQLTLVIEPSYAASWIQEGPTTRTRSTLLDITREAADGRHFNGGVAAEVLRRQPALDKSLIALADQLQAAPRVEPGRWEIGMSMTPWRLIHPASPRERSLQKCFSLGAIFGLGLLGAMAGVIAMAAAALASYASRHLLSSARARHRAWSDSKRSQVNMGWERARIDSAARRKDLSEKPPRRL